MVKKTEKTVDQVKQIEETTFYQAVGRRKTATARVRLYLATMGAVKIGQKEYEKGHIVVNDRPIEEYFPNVAYKKMYSEPFRTTNTLERFVTSIKVEGGGLSGQLGAVIHGISRVLDKIDKEKYHPTLKKHGFLTRDPRAKQRRKAGFAGKSRKQKQSPKR